MNHQDSDNILRTYLKDRKLLIFQPTPALEYHVDRMLYLLNFQPVINRIYNVPSLKECLDKDENIILIANTATEGLGFLLNHCMKSPHTRKSIIMLTGPVFNELDILNFTRNKIDAFSVEPLNAAKVRFHLLKAIENYTSRQIFSKTVEAAAKLLSSGKSEDARMHLEDQLKVIKNPVNSYCLIGELLADQKKYEESLEHFIKALQLQPKNFRALKGSYRLFALTGQRGLAYAALKKLFALYPADPDDLCEGFRLGVQTKQLHDLGKLVSLYFRQQEPTEKLEKYAAAGLAVYCQFLVMKRELQQFHDQVDKIKKFRLPRGVYLNPLIQMFRELNMPDEISNLIKLFRKEDLRTKDYKLAIYYQTCFSDSEQEKIQYALQIISEGVQDTELFEETIQRLIEVGDNEQAERLIKKARSLWPALAK